MMVDPNATSGGQPDDSGDILSILSATSDRETSEGANGTSTEGQGGTTEGTATGNSSSQFQFGGRAYKDQTEAEKAHNQLYGKWSQQQGILNQLRGALKNPKAVQQLAKDPEWASILEKLGVQEVQPEIDEAEDEQESINALPPQVQSLVQQMGMERAGLALEREEWAFERRLGRQVKAEERQAVYSLINQVPALTFEQAWKLALHDKIVKDARDKAMAEARPKSNLNRPAPIPGIAPGMKLDLKKNIGDMSNAEFRESLRQSDEFKQLMS